MSITVRIPPPFHALVSQPQGQEAQKRPANFRLPPVISQSGQGLKYYEGALGGEEK